MDAAASAKSFLAVILASFVSVAIAYGLEIHQVPLGDDGHRGEGRLVLFQISLQIMGLALVPLSYSYKCKTLMFNVRQDWGGRRPPMRAALIIWILFLVGFNYVAFGGGIATYHGIFSFLAFYLTLFAAVSDLSAEMSLLHLKESKGE